MVSFLIIVLFRKDPKLFPKFFDCKFKGSSNEPRKSVAVIWKLNCGYLNSCNVFLFRKLLKHHHRTYHADVPITPENVRTLEVFKVENIYMENGVKRVESNYHRGRSNFTGIFTFMKKCNTNTNLTKRNL